MAAVNPVILFTGPPATGNKMASAGTGLDFAFPLVCNGTSATVQCFPTGSATSIPAVTATINGTAVAASSMTPLAGGGMQAIFPLSGGNAKDVNTLSVTATDNAGSPNSSTCNVLFYLRGAFALTEGYQQTRAKKKAPAKKKAGKKK